MLGSQRPVIARLAKLGSQVLDAVIPPRCAGCGTRDVWLCEVCVVSLPRLPEGHCQRCAAPGTPTKLCARCYRTPPAFDAVLAPFLHDGLARELVLSLKYRGHRHLVESLASLMSPLVDFDVDLVVPVPLHAQRHSERGFNQSALLARALADRRSTRVDEGLLRRIRETAPQTGLNHGQRVANVRGAFDAMGKVNHTTVLLVDDVCTTGATLSACARALRRAGANRIVAIVATRAATLL
jgi:ComF family protein